MNSGSSCRACHASVAAWPGRLGGAFAAGVIPEQPLESAVHERALDHVGGRGFGQAVDRREKRKAERRSP